MIKKTARLQNATRNDTSRWDEQCNRVLSATRAAHFDDPGFALCKNRAAAHFSGMLSLPTSTRMAPRHLGRKGLDADQ
jgi:hypothetical protein